MDNRYTEINDIVVQMCERLKKMGISIDTSDLDKIVQEYYVQNLSTDQIKSSVADIEKQRIIRYEIDSSSGMPLTTVHHLQTLPVDHMGITLNKQDIDLLRISTSKNFEELATVVDKIPFIQLPEGFGNGNFIEYRERVFENYVGRLSTINEFLLDEGLKFKRKIDYLGRSGLLSNEEMATVMQLLKNNNGSNDAVIENLNSVFGEDRVHEILLVMRDFPAIEKAGVKGSSTLGYRRLAKDIQAIYDSITLDEEGKYGKVVLSDGKYDDRNLRDSLEFVRSIGKDVRINTLFFYMDCPDDIYNLEKSGTSSMIARDKLLYYVDEVTKTLAEYSDVVRSVDVFNELLNRYPMDGEVSYLVRGDIGDSYDDNLKSGWLKHLSVEDICEIMLIARENLPNVDFMYNDDHLTDLKKLGPTIEVIQRIQDYGKMRGVKLIDSIGTQMHIDNDVSKENIRDMFIELNKLGLPIEITEFDLAMTSGVEGLLPEEIEVIRQKKINEVYEIISELKDECNIRGFTFWSKTDSQNFRVMLANKELIEKGMKPTVTTLHGGIYTEDMRIKSALMERNCRKQNFNYHGHTSRCGHAGSASDDDYVEAARKVGINRIGFSDHIPLNVLEDWQYGQKMHISDKDEYISQIRRLQKENPDMIIRCGYEAEYDDKKLGNLIELRSEVDYMILGQHYVQQGLGIVNRKNNPEYPLVYAESVCLAMRTGLFDIVAHPDIFMRYRDTCEGDDYDIFMENARKASFLICDEAARLGIPLEINSSGVEQGIANDGEFVYPHSIFWEEASKAGCNVIYGVDSHDPSQYETFDDGKLLIECKIDTTKLDFVDDCYDPVLAREDNLDLQDALVESESRAVTQETALIKYLIGQVEVTDEQDVYTSIDTVLVATDERFIDKSNEKQKVFNGSDETSTIIRERLCETRDARSSAIKRARESLKTAKEMECETKEEYAQVVGLLTETKTEVNPMKVVEADSELDSFCRGKKAEKDNASTNENTSKSYVYTNNINNSEMNLSNDSSDGGYSSSLNLVLVIVTLILFVVFVSFIIR